jgi:PAS domain S-box-containing protein
LQVEKRPFFSASLSVPLLLITVACALVLYYGHEVAQTVRQSAMESARAQGSATAREIGAFLDREHERLRAFIADKQEAIEGILAHPEDWPRVEALQASLKRIFRGAMAFTITGADGTPVFEDFDGLVGAVCRNVMRSFAANVAQARDRGPIPPIHPVPGAYHFDLIAPWRLPDGGWGLFFVSMAPQRIGELIAAGEQASGLRLVVVKRDDPTLIEITSAGARDRLDTEIRLDPAQLERAHFASDIEGTQWRLLVMPDVAALDDMVKTIYTKAGGLVLALLLISAALLVAIRRFEQRNSSLFMRSLQSSLGRQRAILQSMVDGMVTLDAGGEILNVNNAVTRLFGYEPGELIGQNVSLLIPDAGDGRHGNRIGHFLATAENGILASGREVVGRHKDGRSFPVLLTLGESIEDNERIVVGILHDMSAFRAAQKQIDAQASALRRSNQELDEISQVASKDLQLPLMRIASLGESLGAQHQAGEWRADEMAKLQSLTDEARGMSEIVRGLADYARVDDAATDEAVALNGILAEVEAGLATKLVEVGAELHYGELPVVRGDSRQLRQLFWNLLDNALKFRDPARPLRIDLGVESTPQIEPGFVQVLVSDNGIGFDAEHAERVFEAFYRAHPRDAYPGTGLGLAFCRKIVEGMGGSIRVDSVAGRGSTFHVLLPLASVPA